MSRTRSPDLLTTSEVGKILQVSRKYVSNLIDKGLLPGFKLPGSSERRVFYADLVLWMKENKIPLSLLKFQSTRVVLLHADREGVETLSRLFEDHPEQLPYYIQITHDLADATKCVWKTHPRLVLIHSSVSGEDIVSLKGNVEADDDLAPCDVVVLPENASEGECLIGPQLTCESVVHTVQSYMQAVGAV